MKLPEKQLVVGVAISKTSYREVAELCSAWASERKQSRQTVARYVCVTSVHGIMLAHDNPMLAEVWNGADIATPDGMPVVWALRSFGCADQQRVYGPTLMLEICSKAEEEGHRIFLFGGCEEELPALITVLRHRFPSLTIAGWYSPPFRPLTDDEEWQIQEKIRKSDADIVFVGIGTPKQELWMHRNREALPGLTLVGVGAAFDFLAGRTLQAPSWMQRCGLEWVFRLMTEPRRLWRRYLLVTPRFLPLWAKQKWNLH